MNHHIPFAGDADARHRASRPGLRHALFTLRLAIVIFTALALPGCRGCIKSPTPAQDPLARAKAAQEKAKKPKPDFVIGRMMTLPNSLSVVESRGKPGHWTSATLETTANNFNFHGDLVTEPVELDRMPFNLGSSRPIALAKGQQKLIELTFFAPLENPRRTVNTRIVARGDREMAGALQPIGRLEPHQFYLVVLANLPDDYAFLRDSNSVQIEAEELMDADQGVFYRVLTPPIGSRAPLPSNPLAWTTVGYVLWDDLPPTALTPEQQRAMIDWLHWGGQLIVSGPSTLGLLRGSFLDAYLPGSESSDLKLEAAELAEVNKLWTRQGTIGLRPARPWTTEKLVAPPPVWSTLVATASGGPLVVERQVGGGRVVVTAFRLGQRELRQWPGFDEFCNACLLRRAPRKFEGRKQVAWSDGAGNNLDVNAGRALAKLRFFSRDTGARSVNFSYVDQQFLATVGPEWQTPNSGLISAHSQPGVATWDDFNEISNTARDAIREAAGITVPSAMFVVRTLAIYLLVLVPVNWALFRAMGKVEWAWLAVPVLAILFAWFTVQQAQIDIGFARAKTEIAVVETHPGYPRAHVTRFLALYTSLSTSYDLEFDDPSALAQPFASGGEMLSGQSRSAVHYRRAEKASLSGFEVQSNSTGMLRSEEMKDLGGEIALRNPSADNYEVFNGCQLTIRDAAVLRRSSSGLEGAWIGQLDAKKTVPIEFVPIQEERIVDRTDPTAKPRFLDFWKGRRDTSPETSATRASGELNIRGLIDLAEDSLEPGEVRLVGWLDRPISGVTIVQSISQSRQAAVLVAHLRHPTPTPPRPDTVPASGRRIVRDSEAEVE